MLMKLANNNNKLGLSWMLICIMWYMNGAQKVSVYTYMSIQLGEKILVKGEELIKLKVIGPEEMPILVWGRGPPPN